MSEEKPIEVENPPGVRESLKHLKCIGEVIELLKQRYPVTEIARFIQEDAKEAVDFKRSTIIRRLYELIEELPPATLVEGVLPTPMVNQVRKLRKGMNELDEMEKLFKKQMDRLDIDCKTEKQINKLFSGTHKEILAAQKILTDMAELKINLGLLKAGMDGDENAQAMLGAIHKSTNPVVDKVLSDAVSRHRVLTLIEQLKKHKNDDAIEVQQVPQ